MLALALPNSIFDKQNVTFFINLFSLLGRWVKVYFRSLAARA